MVGGARPQEGQIAAARVPVDTATVEPNFVTNKQTGPDKNVELKRKLKAIQDELAQRRKKGSPPSQLVALEIADKESSSDETSSSSTRSRSENSCSQRGAEPAEDPPGALEIFCGQALMTKELQRAGFEAIGIDHKGNKDSPLAKTVWLDLATKSGQLQFWDYIRTGRVRYVHFAPPCGTASRAREVRRRGIDPKPLRSAEFPDGLPNLCGPDRDRVRVANLLYKFTAEAVVRLEERGIAWSIENPSNSWMWSTTWFSELEKLRLSSSSPFHFSRVSFHMCMWGGKRPKLTVLIYSGLDLSTLKATCDDSHEHLPGGMLTDGSASSATALKRNYPTSCVTT